LLLINQDENQVKSRQERCGDTCILVVVVAIVPLLGAAGISCCQDCSARVNFAADASLGN